MLTDTEQKQVEVLITALVNASFHFGSYDRIAIEGRDYSVEFLNKLEDEVNKSAQELGKCITKLVRSREKLKKGVGNSNK